MTGLPELTVTGTLTADPEIRYVGPDSVAVASFTVAANDRRYDSATGAWIDSDATFLRCAIWRTAAENVANSLRKGMRVLLTGVLKQRSYETPEGEKRTVLEVDVAEIGPSLKWATAAVTKASRSNSTAGRDRTPVSALDAPPF